MPLDVLLADLRAIVGEKGIRTSLAARQRASVDEAAMSPLLASRLPLGLADVVVLPATIGEAQAAVALAVAHGVPLTARGKGTGNYGQAIPAFGGIVLDLTRLRTVLDVGEGMIVAEAGARMIDLELRARDHDQQLWIFPSTVQSTLGGFLAGGSAGTGTIQHGNTRQGFVVSLDVLLATEGAPLVHVEGGACNDYLHSFGVTGIIVRATVRLEPVADWTAVYASFADLGEATRALRAAGAVRPAPRLVSVDDAGIVAALPADEALPTGRASLRVVAERSTVAEVEAIIRSGGGRVEAVRDGFRSALELSLLSYNHPSWWLIRSAPGRIFHLEIFGEELVDRPHEIQAALPGGRLHVEVGHSFTFGAINADYDDETSITSALEVLTALGIATHNNHEWFIDQRVDELRSIARRTDPQGLLNPGKFAGPSPRQR
ncbi:hypothetical protein B7R54_12405 [Subtercola boreus]|uniref:FAD-binding PCMH-type domain-containing protein n=1 Tax=Subtercola boreus TaxID=120213 RepID=A0A3E0VJV3_9MICO|nr:FAD-binding oxidoreductase [Subtercola boreus]RFA09915.1 hypothetical protein B7R54_12405 [Subtercola boreus]TQL52949.1 FAD/FMN-containing dehydrogenase [Subtercola boreus]